MDIKLKNNVSVSIVGTFAVGDLALTVDDGSKFPTITGAEYFYCTIVTIISLEVIKVTNVSGNILTVVRAQDNTVAISMTDGDLVQLRLNELTISDYVDQKIKDTSSDHQYIVAVNELIDDRTITLPLLSANDEIVFKDHTVTMTNKTLTSPVLNTGISGTAFLDDDTFATATDTTLASSESIKAYIDNAVGNGFSSKTASYTLTSSDHQIECTANSFPITLPTAVGISSKEYSIKNTGIGTITIDGDGTETIDGELTQTIEQWENIRVKSNNTNWIVV